MHTRRFFVPIADFCGRFLWAEGVWRMVVGAWQGAESERHAEHAAYAPFGGVWGDVVESAYVFDVENLEYVVYAGHDFDVGFLLVHGAREGLESVVGEVTGEVEELGA